jgi:hypothetical protein
MRRKERATCIIIEYVSEDVIPEPGKSEPVLIDKTSIDESMRYVDRALYMVSGSSAVCLGVVAAVPHPAVQAMACTVWAGSFGLAKVMLAKANRKAAKHKNVKLKT